jgi:hypothetical protein
MDIPVTGPILQSKAKEIAQRLHKLATDGMNRSEHVITLTSDLSQVSRQERTWKQLKAGRQN